MDALELLNEDGWIDVLNRVRNSEDLKACSETCLVFEQILWKKKNAFMFDLILPRILNYLPVIIEGEEVSRKALLKCRLVCKDWCKSIDRLEDTTVFQSFKYYCFDSGGATEQFLQMFGAHPGNPIIGRNVEIIHDSTLLMAQPQDDVQNEGVPHDEIFHSTKIRQLLNRFGNEIWTLALTEEYVDEGVHHLARCKNIPTILSHLPNLRNLRLSGYDNLEDFDQEGDLNAELTANPLPLLPHLEDIDISNLNLVMMRSILEKYSSQLKYLTTCWDPICFLEEFPRLSCLKKLDLRSLDASAHLERLRQLHCPLEKLSFNVVGDLTVWPMDELFQNIQHLPIRELEIFNWSDVFLGESAQISPELRIRHESIHKVCIICMSESVSLNFLAFCPNLVQFAIYHTDHILLQLGLVGLLRGHPDGVAELFDVTDLIKQDSYDLYQSNIWEAIPSLKKITLGDYSDFTEMDRRRGTHYHRKTYEKKRKNGNDA